MLRLTFSLLLAVSLAACDSPVVDLAGAPPGSNPPGGGNTPKAIEIPCEQHADGRLRLMTDQGIGLASLLGLASGRYALPATDKPTQMVVMFHGHQNDSCSWRQHLLDAAAKGAVAISMDYTGQTQTPVENYGWCVRAGAADSIAAARYFLAKYPTIKDVFNFSVSMGGNVGGYALASPDAVRADGSPLFDYWVVAEGVHDLTTEYSIFRGVESQIAAAAQAIDEVEAENGGSLEDVPARYAEITNYQHAADMAYLKGAVLVHANDDGLVPVVQSRQMWSALNGQNVPSHLFTVFGTGGDEAGTTASDIPLGPLFGGLGQDYESPLAGHGWEGSSTHQVMKTSLEQLFALMDGAAVSPGETPVSGF
jgi:hypothetical protein